MKNFIIVILAICLLGALLYIIQPTVFTGIGSEPTRMPQTIQRKTSLVLVSSNISARKYGNMYTIVVGEVKNVGNTSVTHIPVTIILRDQAGNIIDTGTTFVEPDTLQPGVSGGFRAFFES